MSFMFTNSMLDTSFTITNSMIGKYWQEDYHSSIDFDHVLPVYQYINNVIINMVQFWSTSKNGRSFCPARLLLLLGVSFTILIGYLKGGRRRQPGHIIKYIHSVVCCYFHVNLLVRYAILQKVFR